MYGDCFAVQREHRLEQSVVSIKPNKYTPTDFKKSVGVNYLFSALHLYFCGQSRVSLRLGHTRVLTCHWHVIHCARAASLRLSLQIKCKLPYEK